MDHLGIFWTIVIGIVAGWLSGKIMRGRGFGIMWDLVLGLIGAFIGDFLFGVIGLSATGKVGHLLMATAGAVTLLFCLRLMRGK